MSLKSIKTAALLLLTLSLVRSGYTQANVNLSNLSATAVNTDLLPGSDNARSLGSGAKGWKQLYVNNAIYLGGVKFIGYGSTITHGNTAVGNLAMAATNSGIDNTAIGANALKGNTIGFNNVAIGYNSLFKSVGGHNNVAVGATALYNNSTGVSNSAFGNSALSSNSGGSNNMAIGANALGGNTVGSANIGIGVRAIFNNTSTSYNVGVGDSTLYNQSGGVGQNTAVGSKAIFSNQNGYSNAAVGYQAMYSSQTGIDNSAIGAFSLYFNKDGSYNAAIGFEALYHNTSGSFNTSSGFQSMTNSSTGTNNTADGYSALFGNQQGNYNTAIGARALIDNYGVSAHFNTGVGFQALGATTNSQYNTAVGYNAGGSYNMGYNNTILGANCDVNAADLYNCIAIGQGVVCTASSQARIGNSATSSIGGWADWSNISDGRFKKNIKKDVVGLDFIMKLTPVTYNLDITGINKYLTAGKAQPTSPNAAADRAVADKEKMVWSGFIAQDVEKAAADVSYAFSGVDKPQNAGSLYGLRYAEFVVPLVKAVQQLSDSNKAKNSKIDSLSAQVASLADQVRELTALIKSPGATALSLSDGSLDQNSPNPVRGSTVISYNLPRSYGRAKIQITDINGRVIRSIPVTGSGKGVLTVDAASLSAGSYPYALYVDGAIVGSRQMLVIR